MLLYSRHDCPLCEDVEDTLKKLNILYEFIDVDSNEKLRKKYHVLVPVLQNNNGEELLWPFDENQLLEFNLNQP